MGAAFIHKRYGWKYSIPVYVGATFVGYSRVQADKHFVEDVIAGATVGIFSSFYFTKSYKGFTGDIRLGDRARIRVLSTFLSTFGGRSGHQLATASSRKIAFLLERDPPFEIGVTGEL